ncbi:MAG: Hachiman antiphage defense system protein HamA [Acutalibacteraceae bacterium]
MNANEIFKQLIGEKIKPMIIKYEPYKDVFTTHPYSHILDVDFEERFTDAVFDSILFYAYEKDEIEKEYQKCHLDDLRKASRVAYENRVPKTEKETDGLLGELTLDCFIKLFFPDIEMLYSRAKYLERRPHKEETVERKGHEIRGYDGMVFSIENGQKYFWVGQVKTGDWNYCLDGIKNDINKSIIKYYFADAITILCDIMRAINSTSVELSKIIDDINDIIFDCNSNRAEQTERILQYFKQEQIVIRIPCLVMPNESDYADSGRLIDNIKAKTKNAFKDFELVNNDNLDIEVLLLVFPLRNLNKVRELFLEVRKI